MAKKAAKKKVSKKITPKKVVKVVKKIDSKQQTIDSLIELIRVTSTEVPDDVFKTIAAAAKSEDKDTIADYAMGIIKKNIDLAKYKSQPLCQDTGTVIFYIYHPAGFHQTAFKELVKKSVTLATKKGYLRQNSVNSLTGENAGTNLGEGHPSIHFYEHKGSEVEVKLVLKGGDVKTFQLSTRCLIPPSVLDVIWKEFVRSSSMLFKKLRAKAVGQEH